MQPHCSANLKCDRRIARRTYFLTVGRNDINLQPEQTGRTDETICRKHIPAEDAPRDTDQSRDGVMP